MILTSFALDFWAAILSMSLPRILQAFTPTGTFGFYAGLNVVAFFLILFFLPEVSTPPYFDSIESLKVETHR